MPIRPPDILESNPKGSRAQRLQNFVTLDLGAPDGARVCLIRWLPAAAGTKARWGAWFDQPAGQFSDPLADADTA